MRKVLIIRDNTQVTFFAKYNIDLLLAVPLSTWRSMKTGADLLMLLDTCRPLRTGNRGRAACTNSNCP
jgi:hypothetical protein